MQLVSPDATTSDLVLIGAEGRADRFTFNSGNYTAPAGIDMKLVKNGDGTYTVTQKNQTTWSFDETGKLLRLTDRFGNQSTLGYDGNGRLVSVSDPAGRGSLTIVNDGSGRITSITDWRNRVVGYGYDASGRLSTVTDREGKVTTYTYDGTTQRIAAKIAGEVAVGIFAQIIVESESNQISSESTSAGTRSVELFPESVLTPPTVSENS
jgi:YD repeat-containing protein